MLAVKVYRHKENKDVYLMRNWGYCGGDSDTEFYKATTNLIEAIQSTDAEKRIKEPFEYWFDHFNGELYVKYTEKRKMQIDGFEGTLAKEIKLYVRDFEKVILQESEG